MAFVVKENDRRPWFIAQLQNDDGTGILLTGAVSVTVIVRKVGAPAILFSSACTVLTDVIDIPDTYNDGSPVTDLTGWVRYKWAAGQTADPGTYNAVWRILWDNAESQTIPTEKFYKFKIDANIEP